MSTHCWNNPSLHPLVMIHSEVAAAATIMKVVRTQQVKAMTYTKHMSLVKRLHEILNTLRVYL